MNYDIYLGGVARREWREEFKSNVSTDLGIFDPIVENYADLSDAEISEVAAKEFFHIENGNMVIIFYLDDKWNGTTSLLEIGDAVGRGKQVIVCLDGEVTGEEKIRRYCEFRGVLITDSMENLVTSAETCLSEIDLVAAEFGNE